MAHSTVPHEARLNFRLPIELKQTIEEAAARLGQSVSDFAVSTLVRSARDVITQERITTLSQRDWEAFSALLEREDLRPNGALRAAARKYKKRRG
jgi:uncharacterized protein (DUF1778 family)